MKQHHYQTEIEWTGNTGKGTESYNSYSREHSISASGKAQVITASSDPAFLGDMTKYNPEELFLASLSSCHMLWYLHLCAANKIVVTGYVDRARGIMEESQNGLGKFTEVTLNPVVSIDDKKLIEKAILLH